MINKRVIILLLVVLNIEACKQSNKTTRIDSINENGIKISTITTYLDDSEKTSEIKIYENDTLKDVYKMRGKAKEGLHIHYLAKDKIERKINYKNGQQDGEAYWYYDNGCIESKSFWLKGKQFGDAFYYNKNGSLESYRSFDFEEHCRYLIKYDINRNISIEDGTVLGQFFLDGDFDSIPKNKSFSARISVATPPFRLVKVFIYDIFKGNYSKKIEMPVINNIVDYSNVFNVVGLHTIVTIGEMRDSMGRIINIDSIKTNVIVK